MENEELFEAMRSDDPEVREEARQELSDRMDDDVAAGFLEFIRSNAPDAVIADAIIGLGPIVEEAGDDYFDDELDPPEMWEPSISRETFQRMVRELRELYEDPQRPKLLRRRAFEVLVRNLEEWQADAIRKHFEGDDEEWKLTAVFGMGYVPGFDREIAGVVNSASGDLLYEAIRSAANREVTEVAPRVRELAQKSSDRDVQLAAIEALPLVDPKCEPLLEKLAQSKDEEIAEAAEAALEELELWQNDEFEEDDDDE
jgi:hypothetical protein